MTLARYVFIIGAIVSFLVHSTFAFCVYNKLNGDAPVVEVRDPHDTPRSFKKTIRKGNTECCHHSIKDCNSGNDQNHTISLSVKFAFDGQSLEDQKRYLVRCAAGGAIEFFGGSNDYYCMCTEQGQARRINLPEITGVHSVPI